MSIWDDEAHQRLINARSEVGLCDGCYANRRGRFPVGYDHMWVCWLCRLTMKSPNWLAAIIRKLDRAGSWRGEDN